MEERRRTPTSKELYGLIMCALESARVFPEVDISALTNSNRPLNLRRIQSHSQMKRLLNIFTQVGLSPRIGYNPGMGDISFTLKLPSVTDPLPWMKGTKKKKEEEGEEAVDFGGSAALIWTGLGIVFEHQRELEDLHAKSTQKGKDGPASLDGFEDDGSEVSAKARKSAINTPPSAIQHLSQQQNNKTEKGKERLGGNMDNSKGRRKKTSLKGSGVCQSWRSASMQLLANECLKAFLLQTKVAIVDVKFNFRMKSIRIKLDSAQKGILNVKEGKYYTDKHYEPFRWSPLYVWVSGYDAEQNICSDEILNRQAERLVSRMIAEFWTLVNDMCYFPDPSLKEATTNILERYFSLGIVKNSRTTAKMEQLSLYLHGEAGIGKSRFVQVFTSCLRTLMQRYLDPERRVQVVRIPLNALTPSNFRQILLVQGISDYSVERILEQTVVRGGTVVLHLEENPLDPDMQEQLFDLTKQLLHSITSRYPEYRYNIIYLFTSNYHPVESIAALSTGVVHVHPPGREEQLEWAVKALNLSISRFIDVPGSHVKVSLLVDPPCTKDMRRMEIWRMSLAFLAATQLLRYSGKALTSGTPLTVLIERVGSGEGASGEEPLTRGALASSEEGAGNKGQKNFGLSGEHRRGHSVVRISFSGSGVKGKPLSAMTDDGFFHYDMGIKGMNAKASSPLAVVSEQHQATLWTILDMLRSNYLNPGVVVLMKDASTNEIYVSALIAAAHTAVAMDGAVIHTKTVTALDESDKEAIIGDPKSAGLGGLFAFIDGVTNPIYDRPSDIAIVVAYVNELGQFMMRELLESGVTRTHRNRIQKHRTLFIMSLFEGVSLSPQLQSRAHIVIRSTD